MVRHKVSKCFGDLRYVYQVSQQVVIKSPGLHKPSEDEQRTSKQEHGQTKGCDTSMTGEGCLVRIGRIKSSSVYYMNYGPRLSTGCCMRQTSTRWVECIRNLIFESGNA